jgi:hypothetical protein
MRMIVMAGRDPAIPAPRHGGSSSVDARTKSGQDGW